MELFDKKSINKFFNLLRDKNTYTDKIYNKSTSKVFIERTLNKWFTGKFIIYYNQNGYKEYVYISNIEFYSYGKIKVNYLDYGNPSKLNNIRIFTSSDDYYGEWCEDESKHLALIEMFRLPKQQFKFIKVCIKDYYKIKEGCSFPEILKQIGEEIIVESITYNKAFKIAKELETTEVKVYQI